MNINLRLSDDLHKKVKERSREESTSLNHIFVKAIVEYVRPLAMAEGAPIKPVAEKKEEVHALKYRCPHADDLIDICHNCIKNRN